MPSPSFASIHLASLSKPHPPEEILLLHGNVGEGGNIKETSFHQPPVVCCQG